MYVPVSEIKTLYIISIIQPAPPPPPPPPACAALFVPLSPVPQEEFIIPEQEYAPLHSIISDQPHLHQLPPLIPAVSPPPPPPPPAPVTTSISRFICTFVADVEYILGSVKIAHAAPPVPIAPPDQK